MCVGGEVSKVCGRVVRSARCDGCGVGETCIA